MSEAGPTRRSTPPAKIKGQAEAQKAPAAIAWPRAFGQSRARSGQLEKSVRATATARPLARIKAPISSASRTEPPCEEMRTGRRRPSSPATSFAKAGAEPGVITPSAEIHSGQLGSQAVSELVTRTIRIGGSP